jgi:hypothetical protein
MVSRAGITELTEAEKFLFKDAAIEDAHRYMDLCIDLLESFDIALRIDDTRFS